VKLLGAVEEVEIDPHWRRQGYAWVFLGIPKISAQKINTYTKIHVYSIF